MSAALFDPDAIMKAIRAAVGSHPPCDIRDIATSRRECRNVATVTTPHVSTDADDEAAAIEERAGLAADSVPAVYLDAWARLNHEKPASVSDGEWRIALNSGGRFLDAWASEAAELGWGPASHSPPVRASSDDWLDGMSKPSRRIKFD